MYILGIMHDEMHVMLCRWCECYDKCIDSMIQGQNSGMTVAPI